MRSTGTAFRQAWGATWRITLFLMVWGGLYAPLLWPLVAGTETASDLDGLGAQVYANAVGAVTVLAAAWIMLRFVDRRPFRSLGLQNSGAVRELMSGLALGFSLMTICAGSLWMMGWAQAEAVQDFAATSLGPVPTSLALNTVLQEVLFRGYIFQAVQDIATPRVALVVSTVLFVAVHGQALSAGVLPVLNLTLAGLLLGVCYTVTGSLWLPIGLHFGWNFLQGPILGLAVTGQEIQGGMKILEVTGPTPATGGEFGVEGGLAATATTLLGVFFVLAYQRHLNRPGFSGDQKLVESPRLFSCSGTVKSNTGSVVPTQKG
ncbi:MAG: CPBP family intramembrane metalloprotease [Acidobacteria bacterium]|nr:CPBP family intramembrane metalloprotease [Acidobacteriota bacterium]